MLTLDNKNLLLSVDNVHAGYGEIEILRGVSFSAKKATITCVIGANGAGKSTLLKTIFGILKPKSGKVYFDGQVISGRSPNDILRSGISYVPQGRCNFPVMSVQENLEMGAYTRNDDQIKNDIDEIYRQFGILKEKRFEMAGNLSGGQQQILEMAMSLITRPQLLLIDEPSLGLSPLMTNEVFSTIQQIQETGTTIVMVEQNAKRALEMSDFAFVLELGRNWLEGSAGEILNNPKVRLHYLGL